MTPAHRKRIVLIVIVLLFAAPALVAYFLDAAGWRPQATRNYGTLLDPARDLKAVRLVAADGSAFAWKDPPDWHWTLLALPGPDCASACLSRLDELRRERLTLNRNATRLRLAVVSDDVSDDDLVHEQPMIRLRDPAGALAAWRSRKPDSVAAALVDPNGFLILTWAAGYDGTGMRKDLAKVVK
jgi:hypothetical protein